MSQSRRFHVFLVMLLVAVSAGSVSAQSSEGWEFQLAPLYLWAVDLGGSMTVMDQEQPFEVKFTEAVDNLEMTFTLHFEAWRGDWGILADVSWLDLAGEMPLPAPDRAVGVDFQQTLVELGGFYRFTSSFSVLLGVRYTALDPKITFPMDRVIDPTQSWTDLFAGFTWRPKISNRWTFAGRLDFGAGGSDLTVNTSAMLDWRIGRFIALSFGYRYLDTDYEDSGAGFAYDASQQGPLAALRFFW